MIELSDIQENQRDMVRGEAVLDTHEHTRTRLEEVEAAAEARVVTAEKVAINLLVVASTKANLLVTEAAIRSKELLDVAAEKARELVHEEHVRSQELIRQAKEADRVDDENLRGGG